jgi:hypothetical protein
MQITVRIHPSWLDRLQDLHRQLAALAVLEAEAAPRPESHALARPMPEPDRGDAWEPPPEEPFDEFPPDPRRYPASARNRRPGQEPTAEPDEEESPPADGRQLLGWASKQSPDAKGLVMSFGKRNGYPSKIVSWTREQVATAYRHAQGTTRRSMDR